MTVTGRNQAAEQLRLLITHGGCDGHDQEIALIYAAIDEEYRAADPLREALAGIMERGCDSAAFYDETGEQWDYCLDPNHTEDKPPVRCDPCAARAALEGTI